MEIDLTQTQLADKEFAKDIWWMMLIRGLVLVVLGLMIMVWPHITINIFTILFSIYLFIVGVISIVSGIRSLANHRAWFLRLVLGLFQLGIGVYLLSNGATLRISTLVIFLGIIIFAQGVVELFESLFNHTDTSYRILLGIGGLLGVIVGIIFMRYPVTSGITFAWLLGLYALISGSITLALSFSFRSTSTQDLV